MNHSELILAASATHEIDPVLVMALVQVESGGNPFAFRYEARYRWLINVKTRKPFRELMADEIVSAVPPPDFPALAGSAGQEWIAQRSSFGLMQVMGAVARELGFRGPFLTQLCDPETNLDLGCTLLADRLRWAKGDTARALGAYNAGPGGADGPQGRAYAAKVLAQRKALQVQP